MKTQEVGNALGYLGIVALAGLIALAILGQQVIPERRSDVLGTGS